MISARRTSLLLLTCAPTAGLLLSVAPAQAASVGSGDVIVYRVGDASAALTSAATPVFLDEFSSTTPQAAPVQSIPLPTTGSGNQRRLTASGSATSEGLISLTADGSAVLATGYDATSGLAGVASTTSASTNRVVARLSADGLVDTSTALTDAPNANNVRSASAATSLLPSGSAAGSAVTVAGGAGSLRGTTLGAQGTSSQLNSDLANIRQVEVTDGKTFVSTGSGSTIRIGWLNGSTLTPLPGLPTSGTSPYSFALLDLIPGVGYAGGSADTLYVADDTPGTVTKYVFNGTTWGSQASVSIAGVRGVAARTTPQGVQLVATTASTLFGLADDTGNPAMFTAAPVSLASAPTNEAFRGVAFAPTAAPSAPTSLPELKLTALLPIAGLGLLWTAARLRRRRSA